MRKAKSRLSKQNKAEMKVDALNELKLTLVIDNKFRVDEMPSNVQSMIHGKAGSIRQLMATHNSLLDASRGQSESNQNAVKQAAATLENSIDQKIDALNYLLEVEQVKLDLAQKVKRARHGKKGNNNKNEKSKITSRKTGSKNVSKKSGGTPTKRTRRNKSRRS